MHDEDAREMNAHELAHDALTVGFCPFPGFWAVSCWCGKSSGGRTEDEARTAHEEHREQATAAAIARHVAWVAERGGADVED